VAVEVWQADNRKGRPARWQFRVTLDGVVVFDSSWVAVRYSERRDAEWLAGLVVRLAARQAFAGCPGHPGQVTPLLWWGGDLGDDYGTTIDGLHCYIEHLQGPVRGGLWYCSVYQGTETLFHTIEWGVQPRSGKAAWWLCEVVVSAERAGLMHPVTAGY
jgi:hypothetical protein